MTLFTFQRDYPGCCATAIPEGPVKVAICNAKDHPFVIYFRNRDCAFSVGRTPGQTEAVRVNKGKSPCPRVVSHLMGVAVPPVGDSSTRAASLGEIQALPKT